MSFNVDLIVDQSVICLCSNSYTSDFITLFTSSIRFSDSLTYTNPLEITSGPDTISPVAESIVRTITIKPSCDKCCLSLKTIFPTSPTPRPSTSTFPDGTDVVNFASSSFSSNVLPLCVINIFCAGIPNFLAVSACAINCLYSPCTGIKNFGFAKAINIGCKYLIKELGPCNLIISNSDVIIDKEEDLKALIKELNKKSVGVVAPTIVENKHLNRGWKNPSPFLDSMLNLIYVHRFFRKKYVFYKEEHYDSRTSLVDVVSGCFFIMKSRTLERIGYLDEHTFLYYEENILAKKIHNEKLYIEVCNDILIIHNHSVSIDKNVKKINKLKLQKESQYYFQTTYNHANLWEKMLLKTTAFCSRMILAVVYFLKDLIGVKKKDK